MPMSASIKGRIRSLIRFETLIFKGIFGKPAGDLKLPNATAAKLPRWRGFNLPDKYSFDYSSGRYLEEDFQLISQLGFNYVRLPLDYRFWIKNDDWESIDEKALHDIDQAVEWGRKYGIHVCVNFHRAPGYCVNPPAEQRDLWTDPTTQSVCARHWAFFARRYRGIPNRRLSFDLLNEPPDLDPQTYHQVVEILTHAIRNEDPERLIIADGLVYGRKPIPELVPLKVAQAGRGYDPFYLSHYKAEWVEGAREWEAPQWPASRLNNVEDNYCREWLWEKCFEPWKQLESQGIGVMIGEWGAYRYTPHEVTLRWMEDCLANWKEAGWGWALWNFRGDFGILDSRRSDVTYENFHGHQLDRAMLELLKKY